MTRRLLCPFLPCSGTWDVPDTQNAVPVHDAVGVPPYVDWLPHCPGSLTQYRPGSVALIPQDRDRMHRAMTAYANHLRARGDRGDTSGGPLGREAGRPYDEIFPLKSRPDEGPQPGEAPHGVVPPGVHGQPLGHGSMDNARDNLRTLVAVAIGGFGQTQDSLARATASIDLVDAILDEAETHVTAAIALSRAAVGTSDSAPEPAIAMVASAAAGQSTIVDDDGVRGALALARSRVALAYASMQAAIEHGRAYNQLP